MILKGQHGLVFEKKQVYFSKAEFFLWNMRWYVSKNTKWFVSILISCWLENKKNSYHLILSPRSLERVLNLWSYKKGKKTHMHSSSDISTSFSETDKHSRMLLHFLSSLEWVGTRTIWKQCPVWQDIQWNLGWTEEKIHNTPILINIKYKITMKTTASTMQTGNI